MKATNNTFNLSGVTTPQPAQTTPMTPAVEETTEQVNFFDLYADTNAFENMVTKSEAQNYYDTEASNFDEFINNTDAVGVSEFGAEPTSDELAKIQAALSNNDYSKEGPSASKSAEPIQRTYSAQEQTVLNYADNVDDPLINSVATFIKEPNAANFSLMVNQVSAVIQEWTNEKTAQTMQAAETENVQPKATYTTSKDGKMYDDKGFDVNPDVVHPSETMYDANGFALNPEVVMPTEKKSNTSKYADIPDTIEENYTTEDDTGYGYGYN